MHSICRSFSSQIAISRNLKEPIHTRVKRLLWSVVFVLRSVFIGMRGMFREQLGEVVLHSGKEWFVSNWAGSDAPNIKALKSGEYKERVPRAEMTTLHTLKNYSNRFRVMQSWYLSNWHGIDVMSRVYREIGSRNA